MIYVCSYTRELCDFPKVYVGYIDRLSGRPLWSAILVGPCGRLNWSPALVDYSSRSSWPNIAMSSDNPN